MRLTKRQKQGLIEKRTCNKCKKEKMISDFHTDKVYNGKVCKYYICKECKAECSKRWNMQNKERAAFLRMRSYRKLKDTKEYKGVVAKAKITYRKKHKLKCKARNFLSSNIIKGIIKRKACEICGIEKTEAHHDDYTKPLDVIFLCRKHHLAVHALLPKKDRKPYQKYLDIEIDSTL